jgi:hypothetical protein
VPWTDEHGAWAELITPRLRALEAFEAASAGR